MDEQGQPMPGGNGVAGFNEARGNDGHGREFHVEVDP